jgi:heterodisulfide reductase subunit B
MSEHKEMNDKVNEALSAGGLSYKPGSLEIRHFLEILYEDVGDEKIKARVTKPLKGLRVAPYYGCQVVRPFKDFDNPEYPMKMDELLSWLGAEIVDYPVKSHCCGGHMTQISEPEAFELIRRLLYSADEYKADVIACMCPMCQLNLDAYQGRVNNYFNTDFNLPILYFTQLIGLAFGMSGKDMGMGKELVAAGPVLSAKVSA